MLSSFCVHLQLIKYVEALSNSWVK